MLRRLFGVLLLFSALSVTARGQENPEKKTVIVASKPFGESFILAEMFAQLLEAKR